jgi:hypothetical protein
MLELVEAAEQQTIVASPATDPLPPPNYHEILTSALEITYSSTGLKRITLGDDESKFVLVRSDREKLIGVQTYVAPKVIDRTLCRVDSDWSAGGSYTCGNVGTSYYEDHDEYKAVLAVTCVDNRGMPGVWRFVYDMLNNRLYDETPATMKDFACTPERHSGKEIY